MAGAAMTFTIVMLVVLAPVISRYSPVALDPLHPLSGPSALHWLGTDELGRDTWARVFCTAGAPTCKSACLAVVFPFCFGVFIGTVCGYFGGRLDAAVMRVVDVVLAFPFFVLIIALVFVVGVGTHGIYIAFGLTDWVVYARTTGARRWSPATSTGSRLPRAVACPRPGCSGATSCPTRSPRRSSTPCRTS